MSVGKEWSFFCRVKYNLFTVLISRCRLGLEFSLSLEYNTILCGGWLDRASWKWWSFNQLLTHRAEAPLLLHIILCQMVIAAPSNRSSNVALSAKVFISSSSWQYDDNQDPCGTKSYSGSSVILVWSMDLAAYRHCKQLQLCDTL